MTRTVSTAEPITSRRPHREKTDRRSRLEPQTRIALPTMITPMASPNHTWVNTIQYDNLTDTTGLNSRMRYEIVPGQEFFFVLNQGWISGPDTFEPITLQTIAKLGWTFRY